MVESLCSSSRRRPNSLTTCAATRKTSDATSAANSLSNARPTRSSFKRPISSFAEAQQIGGVADRPLAEPVDRLAGNEQIPQQDQQGLGRRELRAAVLLRQGVAEELLQAYATEQIIHDGQRPHGFRPQHGPAGTRHRAAREMATRASCASFENVLATWLGTPSMRGIAHLPTRPLRHTPATMGLYNR